MLEAQRFTTSPSCLSKGSANPTWPTSPFSKKVNGRMPLVRSMIWSGMTKSMGLMSSRRDPTAEKAMMLRTPMERRAAMLARAGTSCGANWWWMPWRARKATGTPLCRAMRMGDDGKPHGVSGLTVAMGSKPGIRLRPVPPITAMWTGSASAC